MFEIPSWLKGLFSMKEAPAMKQGKSPIATKVVTRDAVSVAETIGDCLRLFINAPKDSQLEQQIIDKISKIARTFNDWEEVYSDVAPDSKLGSLAIEKMSSLAENLDEWKTVYSFSINHKLLDVQQLAESKLSSLASSFSEWLDVAEQADEGSKLEAFATKQALSLSTSLENLVELYQALRSPADQEVLAAIKRTDATFDQWKSVIDDDVHEDLDTVAREKLISSISSADNLADSDDYVDENNTTQITEAILRLNLGEDDLYDVLGKVDGSSSLSEAIYVRLFEMATTLPDLIDFFLKNTDEIDSELEDKVVAKIASTATRNELEVIKLLTESEGGTLYDMAEEALKKVE